jgi:hypothetical protein
MRIADEEAIEAFKLSRDITRACLQSSSDAAFRKSQIEEWRGSMVSLQTRPSNIEELTANGFKITREHNRFRGRKRFRGSSESNYGLRFTYEYDANLKKWNLIEITNYKIGSFF